MRLTCFIILIACTIIYSTFFGLFSHATGTITLLTTPSLLCEDVVEFNCTLSSGVTYTSSIAGLNINGSATCTAGPNIFNGAVARLSFTSIGGTATAPAAQYTISPFLRQDNATQYRCCADNSASPFNTEFTPYLSLPLAAPPFAPTSLIISSAYDSATSCTGTITLTWLAVASDRPVTIYTVYLNGTVYATIATPMAMNSYTTGTLNLLEHYATYTVMTTSCAGSSMASSPVMFTPLTSTPSTPIISTSPSITSLQSSNCRARIAYTLQQPADSRNVASYHLSSASTVIQTLPANANNMYSFYYDVILNTAASLYITAENCVGISFQLQTTLPTLQGVSAVEVSGAAINTDINLNFNLLFTDTSAFPVAVKFKVFAITTFTDGPIDSDTRSIYAGVQNSGTRYSLTAPIPYLVSGTPLALNSNVQSISIVVSTNSICGQALLLSSRYVHIDLTRTPTATIASTEAFTTPSTTLAILPTTPTSTTTNNVKYVSSSSSPVPDYPTYCPCTTSSVKLTNTPILAATTNYSPITTGSSLTNGATSDALSCNTTPYLVGIIILVLLLLLSILIIAILILFIIYLLKKNNSAPKKHQNTNTDDPTNTAHIYNYIDLHALAETNEEKHYYSDMAAIVQSNASTTATTTSTTNPTTASTTTNDDTNDRTGYYNVSTYANLS